MVPWVARLRILHSSAPRGAEGKNWSLSTGCAAPARTRAALHPWRQASAPLGPGGEGDVHWARRCSVGGLTKTRLKVAGTQRSGDRCHRAPEACEKALAGKQKSRRAQR